MVPDLLRCHPQSPHRPPHWRWERARLLLDTGKKTPGRELDDALVRQAYRFRKALRAAKNDQERYRVVIESGAFGWAYVLWDAFESEVANAVADKFGLKYHSLQRDELEARILAGQPNEEIAAHFSTSAEVVELYTSIFFDVADRRSNPTYVSHQILGPSIHLGIAHRDVGLLWKIWAFAFQDLNGSLMDQIVVTTKGIYTTMPNDLGGRMVEDLYFAQGLKANMAARMIAVNEKTQLRLIELHTALAEIQKGEDASQGSGALFQQNLVKAFDTVNWMVGGVMPNLIGRGGEPRAHELVIDAVRPGRRGQAGEKVLEGGGKDGEVFTFPEPSNPQGVSTPSPPRRSGD